MGAPASAPSPHGGEGLVEHYFALLVANDAEAAVEFVRAAASETSAETVVLDVIAPAQAQVGALWQANTWSVAKEHAATHISERALAAVVEDALAGEPREPRGSLAVACVDGEWHGLPARLVADVLRLRGWRVGFLGSSVPESQLTAYLQDRNPEAVALSCTLQSRLPKAHRMIEAAHRVGLPVLVGGRAFGSDGALAALLGADAWAGGAREAAAILEAGPARRGAPGAGADVERAAALREYAGLLRRRKDLIQAGLRRSMELYPDPGARMSSEERDRTVEDLGHLADFLAASVYVADRALFVRFLWWMREVLESRSVPFWMVLEVLESFEAVLGDDYPAALAALREGRAELAD